MSLSAHLGKLSKGLPDLNIMDFAESERGLNIKLLPFQRFVVKLVTRMELDNKVKNIPISDMFNEKVLYRLTEREVWQYLLDKGRISCDYDEYMNNPNVVQFNFQMGRRAAKSTTIGILGPYQTYRLLRHPDPFEYFGLLRGDKLSATIVGLGEKNAIKTYSKITSMMQNSVFFQPYLLEPPGSQVMKIWSARDLEIRSRNESRRMNKGNYADNTNSISIQAFPNTPGIRGDTNFMVVQDENAFFNQSSSESRVPPVDEEIYDALFPSLASVSNPDGTPFGLGFCISSPWRKSSLFYKQIRKSFDDGSDSGMLSIIAPTWEANSKVQSAYLKQKYKSSVLSFRREFGAEDIEDGLSYIDSEPNYWRCVDTRINNHSKYGNLAYEYFLGADFGLSGDGTAFALSRVSLEGEEGRRALHDLPKDAYNYWEEADIQKYLEDQMGKPIYSIEYAQLFSPGKPPFEDKDKLHSDDMLDVLEELFKHYPIRMGLYDQWSGALIAEKIFERNLPRMRMLNHTQPINSYQYRLFKNMMTEGVLVLPDDKAMHTEILALKETLKNKNNIDVNAPAGGHDDLYDAIIRALFLAHLRYSHILSERIGKKVGKAESLFKSNPALDLLFTSKPYLSSKPSLGNKNYFGGTGGSKQRNPKAQLNRMKQMSAMKKRMR